MGRRLVWISLLCGFWCLGGCGPSKQNPQSPQNVEPTQPQTPQQPVSCVSTTCAAQGKDCGTMSDGCGGTLNCGSCVNGQTCGGGGSANVCGIGSCTPTTCAAQAKNCDTLSDGCGGTLNCGTCSAGLVCGGGGVVNVCGAQVQPGSTRWIVTGPDLSPYTALAADSKGNVVGVTGRQDVPIRIAMHDRQGQRVWARPDFITGEDHGSSLDGVSVSQGNGEICVRGDLVRNGPGSSLLYRLAPDGTNPAELASGNDESTFTGCVESPSGDIFYGFSAFHGSSDEVIYRNGGNWTLQGTFTSTSPDPRLNLGWPIAIDPAGNWIAIGQATGQPSVQGQTVGRAGENSWVVLKFDHSGKLIWTRTLDGFSGQNDSIQAIGTSAIGTIVLLGQFSGTLSFGSDTLTSPAGSESEVLMILEADGAPRWAKEIPFTNFQAPPYQMPQQMAVDPRGQVALLGAEPGTGSCGFTLLKYNLAGDFLWRRHIAPDGCQGSIAPQGLTIASGDVVVAGQFQGSIDFGNGPVHSDGQEAFLLDLAP